MRAYAARASGVGSSTQWLTYTASERSDAAPPSSSPCRCAVAAAVRTRARTPAACRAGMRLDASRSYSGKLTRVRDAQPLDSPLDAPLKALLTVVACGSSTWCRAGESVG